MDDSSLKYILKTMGNPEFDLDAYCQSETYQTILDNCACRLQNPEEDSEETIAFWRERGLLKQLHEKDTPSWKWASYIPVEALNGQESGRTYPLLFILHGANNPIYLAECYGYTHIAAREKLIAIIPENETAESIERLMAYAKEHYPVDWSRVYMVGYSLGGIMTTRHAMRWPERFAAVGVAGMMMANGGLGDLWYQDELWPGEQFTEEMLQHAAEVKIPICGCMGEHEFIYLLPLTGDQPQPVNPAGPAAPGTRENPVLDISSKNKIASVNNWRSVNGCAPIEEAIVRDQVAKTADIVVEKLGYPFERTQVVKVNGRSNYIGDCIDAQGNNLARFICMGKSSHWPCRALTEFTWDFIRKFRRDPETGNLIYA